MKIYISGDLPKSLKNPIKKSLTEEVRWEITHATDHLLQRSTVFEVACHIAVKEFDVVITRNRKLESQLNELRFIWEPTIIPIGSDLTLSAIIDSIENSLLAMK